MEDGKATELHMDEYDNLHKAKEHTSSDDGILNVSKRKILLKRVFCVVILCGMIGILAWHVHVSVVQYLKFEVDTKYQYINKYSMEFPKVTICNSNMLRASTLRKDFGSSGFLSNGIWYLKELFPSVSFITENENATWPIESEYPGGGNLKEFVERNGHRIDRMIKVCKFNGEDCTSNDFVEVMTGYGLCYSFVPRTSNHITDTGMAYGLNLILNVEEHEYYTVPRDNLGFRISVTVFNDIPNMETSAMDLSTGTETQFKIRKFKVVNLPSPYGECVEEGARKLSYLEGTYTKKKCFSECESDFIAQNCSCRAFYAPGENTIPYCSPKQLECFNYVKRQFDSMRTKLCDCPEECITEEYRASISFSKFPSSVVAGLVEKNNEKSKTVAAALAAYVRADTRYKIFTHDSVQLQNHSAHLTWRFLDKIRTNEKVDFNDVWQCPSAIQYLDDFAKNVRSNLVFNLSEMIYFDYELSDPKYVLNSSNFFAVKEQFYYEIYDAFKENLKAEVDMCVLRLFPGDEHDNSLYTASFEDTFIDYYNGEWFDNEYIKIYDVCIKSLDRAIKESKKEALVTDYLKYNFARINIYYGTLKVEEIINEPRYQLVSLFCDFGGLFGILFGAIIVILVQSTDCWCLQSVGRRKRQTTEQLSTKE